MNYGKMIPITMAAVIAMGSAGAAFASSREGSKEISAVLNAKTSVSQAIAAAEEKTAGRATKVEVEHENGAFVYEVKTVSKSNVFEVFVDPASGKVIRTEDEGSIEKTFDKEDQVEFAKYAGSKVTLASAIATAEKETGGKAMEASFESEDGKMVFEVETTKGTGVQTVKIDPASGKVIKITAGEDGEKKND